MITEDDDPDESYHIRNWVASGPREWADTLASEDYDMLSKKERDEIEDEIKYLEDEQTKFARGGDVDDIEISATVMSMEGGDWTLEEYMNASNDVIMENSEKLSLSEAKRKLFEFKDEAVDFTDEINEAKDMDELTDIIYEEDLGEVVNTYNFSWWGGVRQFIIVQSEREPYDPALVFVRQHLGGDVRGNYGSYEAYYTEVFADEYPVYRDRLSYYIEKDGKSMTLDAIDEEGYTLEVVNDDLTGREDGDDTNLDELGEELGFDAYKYYGLGGYLTAGGIGAYLGAKNPSAVKKVTDPIDKAVSDISKNLTGKKKFAKGGEIKMYDKIDYVTDVSKQKVKAEVIGLDDDGYTIKYKFKTPKGDMKMVKKKVKYAKGGKTTYYSNRTSKDFQLGELVYDTGNMDYGTIIGIYPESIYEVRLDSDGMQPTENLRKLGEPGDRGTKKQLFEAVASIERLRREYPQNGYPELINNPFYAKGGKVKWNLSEKEVRDGANNLAKALSTIEDKKFEVHDFEYYKGEGASFELSIDGEKYAGGSYYVKADGSMINAAIGGDYVGNVKDSKEEIIKIEKPKYEKWIAKKKGYTGDLSYWDEKLNDGEEVVVYDKNGVKYIYQGSAYEKSDTIPDAVAVMKGFDESTYRTIPLSEVKSIEIGSIYAKGGKIDKKDNNNMLLGGLAGILFGIFTIK